jgi:DNA anti-recombination protein RmuC
MADIEKESLEAHVELCSERYKSLHDKLDAVNSRLDKQDKTLNHIANSITKIEGSRNKQVMAWAAAIIGVLVSALGIVIFTMIK